MKKVCFTVYCAKNYRETGNGSKYVRLEAPEDATEDEVKDMVQQYKDQQKKTNAEYKLQAMDNVIQPEVENYKDGDNSVEFDMGLELDLDPGTGNTTVLFGSSKQGKTTALMYILKHQYLNDPDNIVTLFCRNEQGHVYNSVKLKCNTFNKKAQDYILMEKFINSKCDNKYNFVNAIDDIIDVRYSKILNDSILTLRNSNISTLICLQYVRLLSKQARGNVNNVLCFKSNTYENTEEIIKVYLFGHFKRMGLKNLSEMVSFYKKVTDDHGFIYINMRDGSVSYHRLSLQ